MRHSGDEVGGRRRDHDHVGIARHADMADVKLALRIEQIGMGTLPRQRARRKRRNEMLRGGGENDAHLRAAVLQAANEIERFVGRNTAADDEKNAPLRPRNCTRLKRRRMRGRIDEVQGFAAGFLGRLPQDDANLILHRAAVPNRAQPQQPLELVVELPNGETSHRLP